MSFKAQKLRDMAKRYCRPQITQSSNRHSFCNADQVLIHMNKMTKNVRRKKGNEKAYIVLNQYPITIKKKTNTAAVHMHDLQMITNRKFTIHTQPE